ncbi:MAG: preprotein translocase subunit SecA, partial [Roseburia hominis]
MSAITKIFGTHSERELKRIYPLVDKVESYREAMGALSDEELKNKTKEYKERLENGETLDDLLPEAYATVREAAKRVLGMEHYRVQIIGGIILHQGRIAEMKTGEGKTLVSTLPAYLNALEGKGVCIVTVNDYLAKRDSEWMGQVHEFLGLKVGVVLNEMTNDERRDAYNCDITYVTNNELGFDYLRDNMVIYKEQLVQRGLHFAIIDEVDSVLIDEARTPLIISGQSGKSTRLYEACDILACQMKRGEDMPEYSKMDAIMGVEQEETGDFIVNEKDKVVSLTQDGVKKVEQFFKIGNLADPENLEIQHNIILALRAHNLMFRDQDYVVKDDQVMIVDEFTGRIMPGRRYSDGLHQAIEAKEHVKVKRESKTLATITFQNFFNKFEKKAGMTGTALTEEKEFRDIYGMDVVEIPTNRPIARIDHHDVVYKTKNEKYKAVVEEVVKSHEKGQPVLVGTINIDTSELISGMLKREGIPHTVLNAKFHEKEAEIVAGAGQHGAVTIATNMAGRGTDIKLDDESKAAGGLKIIGTERHESRRIDNQLRGRSGRQGDPGESQFFISLEDDLMRLFGSEKLMDIFNALGVPEGEQIQHKMLTSAIEKAQKKIEGNNFGIRKNLLEYDQVMNDQREIIYKERRRVLDGENMRDAIFKMITDRVENCVDTCISSDIPKEEWDLNELNQLILSMIPMQAVTPEDVDSVKNNKELKHLLKE